MDGGPVWMPFQQGVGSLLFAIFHQTGSVNEASLHAPAKTIPCRWVIKQTLKTVAIPY
jgi:hypothetical protein